MTSAIHTFRKTLQRLIGDRVDFGRDTMNVSYRTLHDIGLVRGGSAPRPDKYWFN